MTDPYREFELVNQRIGASEERLRILQVIAELPLMRCECDPQWLVLGRHDYDCVHEAEIAYRARVIAAIVPASTGEEEGSARSAPSLPVGVAAASRQ